MLRVLVGLLMVVMGSVAVVVPARQGSACCDTIYAVTSDSLQRFDSATPGSVTDVGLLTGLQLGETIRAIDFRPATGQLYGIGGTGRLYTIDTTTAAATQVGAPFVLADAANVSMDFNPVADRIRVVNRADENFSLNPDTGDVIGPDTNLAYDAADANAGADPGVLAIGYTNNFAGASVTTLYGIDKILDILVRQGGVDGVPSPNGGQLFTIGSLGVAPTGGRVGLDINAGNTAFALMEFGGQPQLFTIDLDRGDVDLVGNIGSPFVDIDIAVQPAQPNPTPPPSAAPSAFGNVNCTGGISSVDALLVLRSIAGLPVSQSEPCEDIDKDTLPNGELQGDVDCSIDVNAVDALKLLRYVAALSVAQNEPCPNIGT